MTSPSNTEDVGTLIVRLREAKSGFFGTPWIDEIEVRANAVIAGPWINQHYSSPEDGIGIIAANLGGLVAWATMFPTEIDAKDPKRAEAVAEFIAHARTDIPCLTTAIRASLAQTEALQTILRDFLKDYDDESGTIRVGDDPGCIECTVGTVPNSLNKGLCAFHRARAILESKS